MNDGRRHDRVNREINKRIKGKLKWRKYKESKLISKERKLYKTLKKIYIKREKSN
jgi:hypothetical protein